MSHYVHGVTGYVDVWDVVNVMHQLMKSSIKNESYILISECLSFKTFQYKVASALNVEPPKKQAKPWLLSMAWRLDWLRHKLLGKRRSLSKQNAKSAVRIAKYDATKLKNDLDFKFKPIETSVEDVSDLFLKDLTG